MTHYPGTPGHSETIFLSVIIPVLNEPGIMHTIDHLGETLEGISFEIIVVDGDPEGSTIRLCEDRCRTALSLPGRGRQMNRGSDLARGEVLLFHHADTLLPPGGGKRIQKVILEGAEAGTFRLSFRERGWDLELIAFMANIRNRFTREPFGDQSFFIRRKRFMELGPFKTMPVMEDVEYMKRLKKNGVKVTPLSQPVQTSARRWKNQGILRTTLRNWTCQLLHGMGVSPWKTARIYSGKGKPAGDSVMALMYRSPEKGKVKSRLAAGIGDQKALEMYRALLDNARGVLYRAAGRDRAVRPVLYLNGDKNQDIFNHEVWSQDEGDLGERMLRFFQLAFRKGAGKAILTGSDIPGIREEILLKGLNLLDHKDSVLGPARDGGYYCIGFNRDTLLPECFQDIPWGTDHVLSRVREKLEDAGQNIGILPELTDIDDRQDLDAYLGNPGRGNRELVETLAALRRG